MRYFTVNYRNEFQRLVKNKEYKNQSKWQRGSYIGSQIEAVYSLRNRAG